MSEVEFSTAEKVISEWWDSCAADARTAGLTWEWDALSPLSTAILNAILDEREACALIIEEWFGPDYELTPAVGAIAIRARGES